MESKVLSVGGRAEIKGVIIPPYPEMLHLTELEFPMVAQLKVNGYNVRIAWIGEDWTCVLREGAFDKNTFDLLKANFDNLLIDFFKENPKKVLCVEIIGKKTMANYKGNKDIDFFVFDIMDMEKDESKRFLPSQEVENICKKYKLQVVKSIGIFDKVDKLEKAMVNIDPVFEGVVLKSLDGKVIMKYKFEDNPELFKDKIPASAKKIHIEKPESRIVGHFFQGYGEKELGLNEGMTPDELQKYESLVDSLKDVEKSKIGESIQPIIKWLTETINKKGSFSEEMKEKIEKEFKSILGRKISKFIQRSNTSPPFSSI